MKFRALPSERRAIRWALHKKSPWSVDAKHNPLRLNPHSKYITSFKRRIKLYYLLKQDNSCCYCKTLLNGRNIESDREHIIARSMMESLTFHTFNLAISCKTCNMTIKSTNKSHIRNFRRTGGIPYKNISDPRNYNIIHPNIHQWYDHIDLHVRQQNASVVRFYYPKTRRGRFTYSFFQLHNFEMFKNTEAQKTVTSTVSSVHPLIIAEALKYRQV